MKALLRPYLLSSSPLWSLLRPLLRPDSSWKFALLVHPRLLDADIVDNVLEFKFKGAHPWTFHLARIFAYLVDAG